MVLSNERSRESRVRRPESFRFGAAFEEAANCREPADRDAGSHRSQSPGLLGGVLDAQHRQSNLCQNILVSAVVAAVVTLLGEYLAKPSLEARKEAIIEGQRLTRSVAAKLALADHLFTKLFAAWNQDSPMQSFEDPETTQTRIVATIDPVMEAVASGQMRTSNTARYAVMAYVALVEFWRDDAGGDDRANAQTAQEFCRLASRASAIPRWRRAELMRVEDSLRDQGLASERGAAWPSGTPWE